MGLSIGSNNYIDMLGSVMHTATRDISALRRRNASHISTAMGGH